MIRAIFLAGSLLLQLSTLCFHSRGAAGDLDLSFDPGSGVNGIVNAVAVQPDGKVIIGGQFTAVKGLLRTNIARLNADGSGDATFIPIRAYNPVDALALQPDGKVLAGGQFLQTDCDDFGCSYPTAVIRLNANGSLDHSFNPAIAESSDYGSVRTLVVQSNGKVLFAGEFSTVNGTNRSGIARLNSNGSLDTSFSPGAGDGWVLSMAAQPDGKVLIGGLFSTFDGTNRNGIARLNANGSLDASFDPGTELKFFDEYPYPRVESIVVQSDGKLIVGGYFTNVTGNSIARFNANGSLDGSFNSGTGANGVVSSVAVQSDGKVLIGGYFSAINGTNRSQIARLNANGSLDSSFNPSTDAGVDSVIVQPDGKLFISGFFTMVNGTDRRRIARLNADGGLDGSFDPGRRLDSTVASLVVQPDGKVLIGGVFTFINGTNRYGSARLNADGSADSTFISSAYPIPNLAAFIHTEDCVDDPRFRCEQVAFVSAALLQPDGKVLIGGYVETTITGDEVFVVTHRFFLARFNADASRDLSFDAPPSDSETVTELAMQPDGKVIVGGALFSINGTNRNQIARLNANGSLDVSFNPGTGANGRVSSIAVQSDGKVLIGGGFTTVNGTNRNRIARLHANGSLDSSFNPGTGADVDVLAIALQPDGNILIGGVFITVNGVLRPYVARLYGAEVPPSLTIARTMGAMTISWPLAANGFVLDQSLTTTDGWSQVAFPYTTNANGISVSTPAPLGNKFFRLRKP